MKKLAIALVLLLGVSTSFANDTLPSVAKKVEVKVLDGLKFKVVIPELTEKATVMIKNNVGEVLYKEYVGESTVFSKVYNLAGFPDGEYAFEVKVDGKVVSKEVKINTTVNRVASVN
ncbi:hypothetical protein [Leadbetterella byssophila]|jgi:hypothetical protein|uniref:Secretion system C-terminal sorting domain-containing protein n=1 Tax=Leadbetterella byssophila (strain DSM 17132 / JCM 16389 / KACC 11308 / NBRC 106382 / 4M15) TaxID=649349 RepID=E4RT06_LEAB4|nr:hypothetical protein [Leadbetterella byssophila]ADQ17714.1 hypothetical protein Lbys_2018 [Leadbetterella byssophila DSM 17132]